MRISIVLAVLVLTGCMSYGAQWERALRDRAPFELRCAPEKLKIGPITSETYGTTGAPLYQGVEGCGIRAVYVATPSGYVLNSVSGPGVQARSMGGAETPAAAPPPPVVH